jgi:regulator of replication initiation timing
MSLTCCIQLHGKFSAGERGVITDPVLVFASDYTNMVEKLSAERDHWKANHDCLRERARLLRERLDMPVERVQAFDQVQHLQQEVATLVQTVNELSQARTALEIENGAIESQLVEARALASQYSQANSLLSRTVQMLESQVKTLQAHPQSYQTGYNEGRRLGSKLAHQERRSLGTRLGELQKHADSLELFLGNSDKYCRSLEIRIDRTAASIQQAFNAKFDEWHPLLEEALRCAYNPSPENVLWSHITKGGHYALIGESSGAGTKRGEHLLVYRDTRNGALYHRTHFDFRSSMVAVDLKARDQALGQPATDMRKTA